MTTDRNSNNRKLNKVIPIGREIPVRFISLFAGCGGSSKGYTMAGLEEIFAIEWDKHAREVFKLNFPNVPVFDENILELTGQRLLEMLHMAPGELDVFDASPPCQAFSTANSNRNALDEKNDLYFKTIELIDIVQPKVFVIENVEGMRRGKMIPIWNKIVNALNKLNYRVDFKVLKAEFYSVPQERRRVIVVGVRSDLQKQFNIGQLLPDPILKDVSKMAVNIHLPKVIGFSPGQFDDKFIPASRPMCTITKTGSAWVYEADGLRRKPTIDELKILSSFPADFKLCGSFNQQWARIGNAVPPLVTKAIGMLIISNILTQELLSAQTVTPVSMAA